MNSFDASNYGYGDGSSDRSRSGKFSNRFKQKVLPEESYDLGLLESMACACLLDEAANKLSILGSIGDLPQVQLDPYRTLKERFETPRPDIIIFDPETIEPYEVALAKQNMIKFQKDILFAENTLRNTASSLACSNKYDCLVNAVEEYYRTFAEENELLETEVTSRANLENLCNLLENERRQLQSDIQNQSKLLAELKDLKEDTISENAIKKKYVEQWENSRVEQNVIRLDKEEEVYLNIINESKINIDRETRISAEIEAYINETKTEYEEGIQMWMEKYDHEIELRDTEIQVLKEKREDQFNRLRDLSKLYDRRKVEMEDYLAVKEQRRLRALHLAKLNKAATKIQAWWRGLMVRKGFGPFRKKKGKDAAKKKKGKK